MSPMGWMRQVRHVAWKDLRNARWIFLAFVALAAAAPAFGIARGEEVWSQAALTGGLALVSGLVLTAVLVQADPPARGNTFWAATPLLPTAVLGAKLLISFGVVLASLLLGQLVVAVSYRVPIGEIAVLLWQWADEYGTWIFAVLVFAAVFRTFTSVILASVLTVIAGPLLLRIAVGPLPESAIESAFAASRWTRPAAYLVMAGGGLLLLSHLYRSHDERRRWVITGLAIAVGSVLLGLTGPSALPDQTASLPDRSELDGIVPRIRDIRYVPRESGPLRIQMTVRGSDATDRYRVVPESAWLMRGDGSVQEVPIELFTVSGDTGPPESAARTWLGAQRRGPAATDVHLQLDASDWELVRLGQRDLQVTSRVELLEPRPVAVLPIEVGANAAGRGTRIEISDVAERAGGLSLQLSARTLEPQGANGGRFRRARRRYGYALIHEGRGEGIPLTPGSGGSLYWPYSVTLPVSGPSLDRSSISLSRRDLAEVLPDQEWLREARLRVFDWVAVGARNLAVRAQLRHVNRRPQ